MMGQGGIANELMYLDNSHLFLTGDFHCQGDVVANYSDDRLKQNMVPIQNALSVVAHWRAVRYTANIKAQALGGYDLSTPDSGLVVGVSHGQSRCVNGSEER